MQLISVNKVIFTDSFNFDSRLSASRFHEWGTMSQLYQILTDPDQNSAVVTHKITEYFKKSYAFINGLVSLCLS